MPPLLLLLLSLLPLAFAPALATWARRSISAFVSLDAFVAVTIAGVSVNHILPEAIHEAGLWALGVAVVGFLLPIALHMGMHRLETKALPALVAAVLAGLALHAVGDGIALMVQDGGEHGPGHGHDHGASGMLLPAAVVLHRLPESLAIWWFARPVLGRATAITMLLAIGLATIVGFSAADHWFDMLNGPRIALLHAFVVGMLFHVLLGHHRPKVDGDALPVRPLVLGGGLGIAFLVAAAFVAPSPLHEGPMRAASAALTLVVVAYALASRTGRGTPHTH